MLEIAQEDIGVLADRVDRRRRKKAALGERREGRQRAAGAQVGLAPAAHELQRLHDELDLANAARAELDVVRVIVALALLGDLPMDVAQPVVGVVVEVLAKDERRHQRVELVVPLARQRARLEPGVALPGATLRDEVLLERRVGHRQRPALAVGSKPHVDAENEAFRR